MSYTSGNIPHDASDVMPVKEFNELPQLKLSGLFKIGIQNAELQTGTSKDGKPFSKMRITAGVYGKEGIFVKRCRFSFYLPSSSAMTGSRLESLCYFTNQRDDNGNLFCPDAKKHDGVRADGTEWEVWSWGCFRGRDVYVLVDWEGEDQFNGFTFQKYKFIGFCDQNGRTAQEVSDGLQAPGKYKTELDTCLAHQKAQLAGTYQPPVKQPYGMQGQSYTSAQKPTEKPKAPAKPAPSADDAFTDDELPF